MWRSVRNLFVSRPAVRRRLRPLRTVEVLEVRLVLDASPWNAAVQSSLDALSPEARANAESTLAGLDHLDEDEADALRFDAYGNVYFFDPVDDSLAVPDSPAEAAGLEAGLDVPQGIAIANVPVYHSLPGATKILYLDFNGHTVTGTPWNSFNGGNPIHAAAYSTDSNINDFTQSELDNIYFVWQRVAEDFAPFQIDVTTEDPGDAAFAAGKTALRVLISTDVDDASLGGTGNRWYSGAGGVAYIGLWNWTDGSPVWVFENNLGNGNEKYVGEAASHEAGHAFGLSHDGRISPSESYYQGHGSGDTGWAPIMGVGYYKNLSQWSKGEYTSANNTQDDLAIITSASNQIVYRTDEDGSSADYPTSFVVNGSSVSASGIIATTTDVDVYAFDTAAGTVTFNLDPAVRGPNLDILAELRDRNGNLVASNNPSSFLYADIVSASVSAGTYYLHVSGVGLPTPPSSGYTDYGSLGQYTITGTIVPGTTGVAVPANLSAVEISTSAINLSWTDAATNETNYTVQRSTDGTNWTTIATLGANANAYTATSLISSTLYYFRVRAYNAISQSAYTPAASAVTQGTAPTAPGNLAGTPVSSTQINLAWVDNSNNETSFSVERRTPGGTWTVLATLGPNVTTYSSTGLAPLTTYEFRVNATNLRGTSGYSSTTATTLDGIPLSPSNVVGTILSPTSVRLDWTDNSINESGFQIERYYYSQGGTGGGAQGTPNVWEIVGTVGANVRTWTDTAAFPGTYFNYRVSATNSFGASSPSYGYANIPDAPPSNLAGTPVAWNQVDLTWTDNSTRETGYTIERSLDGTNWSVVASLAANVVAWSDTTTAGATTYHYRAYITPQYLGAQYFYSNTAIVTTPAANGPPVAGDDAATTYAGLARTVAVLANDTDPDGNPLTVQIVSQGNGTAVVNADGTVTWTPTAGFVGSTAFTYRASDGTLTSNTATVSLTVLAATSVKVSSSDTAADELGGTASFTFTRTAADAVDLVVNYSMSSTAKNGTDYQTLSGTATILAGQTTATVVLVPLADTLVEGRETAKVTLLAGTGYVLGSPTSVNLTIHDEDKPSVSVSAADNSAREGEDTGTFRITRTPNTSGNLTVQYTLTGTATNGTDFQTLSGTAVILDGQSSVDVTVTALADYVTEGNETVVLTLTTSSIYHVQTSSATVTIKNGPTVTVTAPDATATEGATDRAYFRIARASNLGQDLTVYFAITGTATNGTDYVTLGTSAVILAGQSYVDVYVDAKPDALSESNETVILTLTADASYALGSSKAKTITIKNGPIVNSPTAGAPATGDAPTATTTDEYDGAPPTRKRNALLEWLGL